MRNYTGRTCGSFAVCIDSYRNGVPVGRFYTGQDDTPYCFENLTRCLSRMEQVMDERQNGTHQERTAFASAQKPPLIQPEQMSCSGKTGTFVIRVLFRQNQSWQGSVTWLEGRQERSFRSVLELILLMDSALQSHKER